MNSLLFDNLLSWSAEVSILAIAAAAAACALRHSRARLYFWQAILAVALILPAIAPWKQPVLVALPVATSVVLATNGVPVSDVPVSSNWGVEQLLMLLAAGAALRLIWVAMGLLRLTRIRKLRPAFGATAGRVRRKCPMVCVGSSQRPSDLRWLRPIILLPTKVCELPASAQEAIASHELFHVHRRDWLFVMLEELIRSVLWFHPAVWFVLSRIQLAREQVVDQEVVHATRDRAGYLDALVSVAAQKLQADVAPAPLFLKKRQLAVRVQALLKETSMSAFRLAAHVSVAASVAIIGAFAAVWFFPLQSAAQVLPDDPGITVDAGAVLAHRSPVHNPSGGSVTGDVLLELKLNSKGEVADARVLSGPDELRKAALTSVLDWHYAADTAPPALVHATIHFGQRSATAAQVRPRAPPPAAASSSSPPGAGIGNGIGTGIGNGIGTGIGTGIGPGLAPPPPPPPPAIAVVEQIQYQGLSPELQQRVQNGITIHAGDVLDVAKLKSELQEIDQHLVMSYSVSGPYDPQRAQVNLRVTLRPDGTVRPGTTAYKIGRRSQRPHSPGPASTRILRRSPPGQVARRGTAANDSGRKRCSAGPQNHPFAGHGAGPKGHRSGAAVALQAGAQGWKSGPGRPPTSKSTFVYRPVDWTANLLCMAVLGDNMNSAQHAQITYISDAGVSRTIDVPVGDSVMEGAVQNGVDGIVAECGGNCQCATCHVYVEEKFLALLKPMAEDEDAMLETTASPRKSNSRLSCQLHVTVAFDGLVVHTPPTQQ